MHRYIFSLLFLILFSLCIKAQTISGTARGNGKLTAVSGTRDTINDCLGKVASLFVHIVKDSLRHTNIAIQNIFDAVDTLNHDFKPVCLQFKICKIDSIDNWNYDTVNMAKNAQVEMVTLYNVPKAINVYIITDFIPGSGECGFAPIPTAPGPAAIDDYIFLKKSCIEGRNITISHEFGHYFGLYHTFETAFCPEHVNEDNCLVCGDRICDTDAGIRAPAFSGCTYIGNAKDANNDFYTPLIGNIMSYDPEPCKTKFTNGQLNRVAWVFRNYRSYIF
jgi:hypothetical protein